MKPRGLIIALVISVALNLFLAGLIVGGVVVARRAAEARPAGAAGRLPLWRAGDALPPEKRRAYRRALGAAARASQDEVRKGRALRRQAMAMLDDGPFEAETAVRMMDQARDIDSRARMSVEAAVLRFAAQLTPEERRILGEGLRQSMAGQLRDPVSRPRPPEAPPP